MEKIVAGKEDSNLRIDKFLKLQLKGLPQALIQKWSRNGLLRLNEKRCKPDGRIKEGDNITFPTFEKRETSPKKTQINITPQVLSEFKSWILFEDEHMFIINKPPGFAVQGGTGQNLHLDSILDALSSEIERPRRVHRLDMETSGLLVIAKKRENAACLSNLF